MDETSKEDYRIAERRTDRALHEQWSKLDLQGLGQSLANLLSIANATDEPVSLVS